MDTAELKEKNWSLSFTGNNGAYSLTAEPFEFSDARPGLYLNGKKTAFGRWKILRKTGKSILAQAENQAGKWQMQFTLSGSVLTIRLGGTLTDPCSDLGLYYMDGADIKADHLLSQGLKMGRSRSILPGKTDEKDFIGYHQVLFTRKGTQLQLSYPLVSDFMEFFSGQPKNKRISGLRTGASIKHFSGRKIVLAPLTFRIGDGFALMYDYGENNRGGEKDFSKAVQPGWNTWDYYRWTVTEDEVLANAEFIARDPVLSRHVKKIIVDDGWQYAYGEWEANSLFPHGMKYLADKIRKLGMEPGLWVAPVILEPHSRIAQTHPEMLAKGEGGLPLLCWQCIRRYGFILDPTVEKSRQFLRDTFERLLGCGYTYFKLDFLGGVLDPRRFTDRKVPRGRLMDLSIGTIYRAVAGRARILGCNYLFGGGPDIADAVRIGNDIHAKWECIKKNAVSVASNFWANKKLWVNDPDFALCRSLDTADDPDMFKIRPILPFLSPEEKDPNTELCGSIVDPDIRRPQMEVLLSVALMAGGAVNLSDNMRKLNESGLDLARRTVSAESGDAAVPLDLFSSDRPSYWLQKLKRGNRALLINWEDTEQERSIDLNALGLQPRKAVNFWNDKAVRIVRGRITEVLPPRSCLLVVIS